MGFVGYLPAVAGFLKTTSRQGAAPAQAMVWTNGETAMRNPLRAILRATPGGFGLA
jgi:hypothetical protein